MSSRLFLFLYAFFAAALPEVALAGSGGPSAGGGSMAYIIIALLVIIILMLAWVLKKIQ
jgi:hypothetical protein